MQQCRNSNNTNRVKLQRLDALSLLQMTINAIEIVYNL